MTAPLKFCSVLNYNVRRLIFIIDLLVIFYSVFQRNSVPIQGDLNAVIGCCLEASGLEPKCGFLVSPDMFYMVQGKEHVGKIMNGVDR